MERWQRTMTSEYGYAVYFKDGSVCIFDLDDWCRGFVAGTDRIGLVAFNQTRREALAAIFPDGRIMDTRLSPPIEVNHKDVIRYLVENAPQIRDEKFHISHQDDLRSEKVLPADKSATEQDLLGVIAHLCHPNLDINPN